MLRTGIKGRPTKYLPQTVLNLCKWIREGNTYKDACAMEGISYETFRTWEKEKSAFSVAVGRSEALCKSDCIALIQKAEKKDWKAAAWILEHRFPQEYSLRTSRLENNVLVQGVENAQKVVDALFRAAEGAAG